MSPSSPAASLKANLAAATAATTKPSPNYKQTILKALREVEDSLLDLQGFASQREATVAAMKAADETSRLARVRYDQRTRPATSKSSKPTAPCSPLSSLWPSWTAKGWASSVVLAKALGGGWKR